MAEGSLGEGSNLGEGSLGADHLVAGSTPGREVDSQAEEHQAEEGQS